MAKHNEVRACTECGGLVTYIEHAQWAGTHYEILDAWWSHHEHPEDGHEARACLCGDVTTLAGTSGYPWCPECGADWPKAVDDDMLDKGYVKLDNGEWTRQATNRKKT